MKQSDYQSMLENTHLWSNQSVMEQENSLSPLLEYVHQNTPKKLFRFRDCSERSFDAFYRDQIWTSSGDTMNDDFDARMFFRIEELEEWIEKQNAIKSFEELLRFESKTGEIPQNIKMILPNIELLLQQTRTMPKEKFAEIEAKLKNILVGGCGSYRERLIQAVQQTSIFACFSSTITSPLMWGHYANSASGFAIAYNFKDHALFDDDGSFSRQYNCELFPILYTNQRFDATDYAKNMWLYHIILLGLQINGLTYNTNLLFQLLPPIDQFISKKIALYKSKDWAPEKEWRLFINSNNPNDRDKKHIPVPKRPCALYLGRKISSINEKILKSIAEEKNLPIYKMEVVNDHNGYKLHPKRITK